ncbi:MAG: hypothetical protein JW789_04425 [Candidatus Aenigmarchaeota archaeon]|nr:hypothetical protein [Candidatus Aenigmarchaeota archaeon]
MFSKFHKMKSHHQTIFTIVIAFAVISFWRGVWGLMDEYMLPVNTEMSYWVSVVIGLGILIMTGYATKELA